MHPKSGQHSRSEGKKWPSLVSSSLDTCQYILPPGSSRKKAWAPCGPEAGLVIP